MHIEDQSIKNKYRDLMTQKADLENQEESSLLHLEKLKEKYISVVNEKFKAVGECVLFYIYFSSFFIGLVLLLYYPIQTD